MKKTLLALTAAVSFAAAMLLFAPQAAFAQGACGAGFCSEERLGCISLCGRCIAQFSCTVGASCSSDCKCGTPGCGV